MSKLITVKVCFRIYDQFLLKWNYFYKEMKIDDSLKMEEALNVVADRYPKFVYFEWKGQSIKNTANVGN